MPAKLFTLFRVLHVISYVKYSRDPRKTRHVELREDPGDEVETLEIFLLHGLFVPNLMEDNDWTDNPLISCVEYQDSNSDTEKNTNSLLYSQNEKTSETVVERNDIQESSNSKQEKESCPICLSSFEDKVIS